jgi:hypothetical protein
MQETPPPQPLIIAGSPLIIEDGTATTLTTKRSLIPSADTFDTFDASTIKSTNSLINLHTRPITLYSDEYSIASSTTTYWTTDDDDRGLWDGVACPIASVFDVAASAGAVVGLLPAPSNMSMYDDATTDDDDTLTTRSPTFGCSAFDVECAEGNYMVMRDENSILENSILENSILELLDGESVLSTNDFLCGESVTSKNNVPRFESPLLLRRRLLRCDSLLDDDDSVMDRSVVVKEKGVRVPHGDIGEGVEVPLQDIDTKDPPSIVSEDSSTVVARRKMKTNGNTLKKSVRSLFGGKTNQKVVREAKVTTAE